MSKIFKSLDDVQPAKNNGTDKLGTGSFSKVNLVCHKQNPSECFAMKEVHLKNEKDRKLVFQEINLHMTLVHDNVIRFMDYIEMGDKVYIFLEYAPNGDLFGFVNKNKPNEQTLLKLFYQTCVAIQYIHSKNIMHRDLKPENILLDADHNVKLCDFGWSAEYYEDVNRETLCGTFEYMAPEVFFRNKQTKKTDIWALGVLLYELFHGYAPFRGMRMDTVMHAIMRNVVAFKKNLDPSIKDLIIKILVFDPKKRPTIEDILQHPLMANFAKSKGDPSPEKENFDKVSKPANGETKSFRKKPVVFSSSFYNTISAPNEPKYQSKQFAKPTSVSNYSQNYNNIYGSRQNDFSSFKKKSRNDDYADVKQFNSVDKVAATGSNMLKRYNTAQVQNQHTMAQNIYAPKPPSQNHSFHSSISSGVKIVSKRTINNPADLYNSSNFNTYSKPDFGDGQIRNIYNTSGHGKYSFVKKTNHDGDRSFSGYLNSNSKS